MADNLITTNITANADFTSLRTQLAAVTAQLVKLQETTAGTNAKLANQIAVMNKSFAETMRSTGQFSSHFVSLTSDVEKFGRNLDRGRLKLGEYYNAWSGHTKKTSSLIRDLAKQQVMLENAIIQPIGKNAQGLMQYNVMVAKGLDEIKNKTAIARQELSIMNKVMLDGSNQLINWGKNTQWAGRQLTVGLTVPLAAFGMAAQKAFKEADQELVRLTKVYGGLSATSSSELAKVRKDVSQTAREIAGAYGIAYKETIALAADLAATGQEGGNLLEATRQTSRLSILGEVDRQEAMKATLAIQNAFKQNTEELTQSIDFLNAVENQTSTSLQDLTEAIPKAGPVVKSLGGDVKDLALYLTAMKEGGVNASEGANAIKSAMASLINPTKVAREMFFGFGIDIDKIVTSNAGNLTETITDLQSALDRLDPLSKSRAIEQLFGKFQYARMSALFENLGKEGSQTLQVMDLMKASASELASISARELTMMTESASGQFKRAWASVQADLASVGEQFLKISTKVLNVVDGIIKFFQGLPGPVKTFLNALGGLTAFAGPLIMLTGVMANFIGYVTKGIFSLRQMATGGHGFKLLTPEILAADAAAKGLATSFYSDTEATVVLTNAVNTLAASFDTLQIKADAAKVAVQPAISTVAGGVIAAGTPGGTPRIVDKNNPLVGDAYSRDMSHMIPAQMQQPGTIFGTVPGASPVNVRIGKNPQAYMNADLPKIPGVTSVNGISTGVVAQEAAKWHAMTAAIAMQSEAEIKVLKAEVQATGTVTASLSDSYQALLPEFSEITSMAAQETALIVKQLQQSKITADEARIKVIQLNATVEAMLAETAQKIAAGQGRSVNLTTVPLTTQPVVDPVTGKSNMKEMFHKGTTKDLVDKIARSLGGVRTSGAGYNIQTTKPKFNKGGIVPGTGNTDTYHTMAEPESFVINKAATERNMPTISKLIGGTPTFRNTGGMVPVVLTPGEAVIPANIAKRNPELMLQLNGGPGNTTGMGRHQGGGVHPHPHAGKPMTDAQYRRALKMYYEFINDDNYENNVRARFIALDASEYLGVAPQIGTRKAIEIATANFEAAKDLNGSPEDWIKTRTAQLAAFDEKYSMGNKKLVKEGRSATASGLTSDNFLNRNMNRVLRAMSNDPFFADVREDLKSIPRATGRLQGGGGRLVETARGHAFRRSLIAQLGGVGSRGFAGFAAIMPAAFNTIAAQLQGKNFQPDVIHLKRANAIADFEEMIRKSGVPGSVDDVIQALQYDTRFVAASDKRPRTPPPSPKQKNVLNMFLQAISAGKSWIPVRGKLALAGPVKLNKGGQVPGKFAQRLFGGGKALFLGMPRSIKQVEAQRAAKAAMEKASQAVKDSRFSKTPVTDYDGLLEPTSGRSFPVSGIGGVYSKGGEKVFVKPVLDEKAALAELRATEIARDVHGLQTPNQRVVVMRDPTDRKGSRTILALESKYNPAIANQDGKFTEDQYFRQLVASALRGDKDLGRGNLSGNILADVGTAGVFATASGPRDYSTATIPSFKHQAMVNLMGVKGSGAKKFFAESTADIPMGMTSDQYNDRMLEEINKALPKLKQTIGRFDLNSEEKAVYNAMITRLSDARRQTYGDLHGIHSSLKIAPEKTMTPAAIAKMLAADELKRRQRGHSASLSDNDFKNEGNRFNVGGLIGNVLKGKAMHRIGAGFGPTGAPKPSMYESAPWGVNSLSIQMADTLFANTGLRKHTQKLFYDKFAAALAKEKPYGYVKMPDGKLKNGLEPDVLDSVIRSAASDMIGDRAVLTQLSPIDKDILRKKYLNWDSKKDTPLTESLKKVIFGLEKREMGGPVNAGQPYVVGEKGPEVFVPRNSGGIVPNRYMKGGNIAMLGASLAPMLISSKIANPLLQTIMQTLSFILPQMMMTAMMQTKAEGAQGRIGGLMSKIPASAKTPIFSTARGTKVAGEMLEDGTYAKGGRMLNRYGAALQNSAKSGSAVTRTLGRIGMGLTRLNVGLAVATGAFILINKRIKDHNEHLRVGVTQYGLTEEAAKKAGLKFTDYNSKLADTVKNIEAIRERNQMLYESMQDAGLPISMTIEEYKKLKKEVKEVYTDQIKLINQSKESELPQVAIDIKTALMAAGLSADEASKKIFAMFKLSEKGEKAGAFTVGNRAFRNIKTGQDAAEAAINNYVPASAQGGREGAQAVNTGLTAIDAGIIDMIEQSKKAAREDKTGNTQVLTQYQAQEAMLQKLNKLESSKAVLTARTRGEMIKQNPELIKIINPLDTVVSLFEKMNLAAKGFTGDLSKLGAEAVSTLSRVADATSEAIVSANKEGFLKKNYDYLGKLTDQQKALMRAAKGQTAQQQINTREQLKGLQKQIDANNKLAEARLKALDAAKQEGDIARQIAKAQAAYESALATGNTAAAQQASLDIQGLQSDQQYNSQKKAIEDALKLANAPLEAKIKLINDGQQKLSDNASIAAESLGKLNEKIAKEKQKIDDVNKAMTTLAINAIAAGKELKDYIKTGTEENPNAGKQDAAAVLGTSNTAVPGTAVKPPLQLKRSPRVAERNSVEDQALGLMGGVAGAVEKGLAAKGINVNAMTGDIIINGKKMDVSSSKATAKIGFVPTTLGSGAGAYAGTTLIHPSSLINAGAQAISNGRGSTWVGVEFADKNGKKWKVTSDAGQSGQLSVQPVKAGYGTMKLNPKVPTIVGDRGPEMAFGGMVIPNMAKVPYASPRYDVKQAAKMFEPMRDSGGTQGVINYTQNIYASPGMNEDQLISKAKVAAYEFLQANIKSNAKMVGNPMNVGIKKT
jgi:TP901 family phage tail tape measure protein